MIQLPDELTERARELANTIWDKYSPSPSDLALSIQQLLGEAFSAGWRAGAEAMRNKVLEGKPPELFMAYVDTWPLPEPPDSTSV